MRYEFCSIYLKERNHLENTREREVNIKMDLKEIVRAVIAQWV
jgi:hypothetical protein